MKRKLAATTLAAGLVAIPVTAVVTSTSASHGALCQIGVKIKKNPGVIHSGGTYGVETGEYQPYTTC